MGVQSDFPDFQGGGDFVFSRGNRYHKIKQLKEVDKGNGCPLKGN